jgi:hypothetical protein
MYSTNSNGNGAAPARGFMALFAMLAMGLGLMASRRRGRLLPMSGLLATAQLAPFR